ncbi:hypothetical protein [Clostridium chrysemydis]|uniref:hypothetical protein n=1 Tax=Clostridium chrysemydis TaxID=2665504 RepID=UPI0018833700|nr:hypothetical protein [Clostridium chrysemydis]
MAKKGKRNLILEMGNLKLNVKEIEKLIQVELKRVGIKYADDVEIYLNTSEQIAYCVCNDKTIKIKL